jgi:hypothetical protein
MARRKRYFALNIYQKHLVQFALQHLEANLDDVNDDLLPVRTPPIREAEVEAAIKDVGTKTLGNIPVRKRKIISFALSFLSANLDNVNDLIREVKLPIGVIDEYDIRLIHDNIDVAF